MKLLREIIPGNVFINEEVSGIWKWLFVMDNETIPTGYEEVETNPVLKTVLIHQYASRTSFFSNNIEWKVDYKFYRDIMKEEMQKFAISLTLSTENDPSLLTPSLNDSYLIGSNPVGEWVGKSGLIAKYESEDPITWSYSSKSDFAFDNSTNEIKQILCYHKLANDEKIKIFLNNFEQYFFIMANYSNNCCNLSRKGRMQQVQIEIWTRLGKEKGEQIWQEAMYAFNNYLNIGTDGIPTGDDLPGPIDYIYGTQGTIYEDVNLISKNWEAFGFASWPDFCGYLYSILISGYYLIDFNQ